MKQFSAILLGVVLSTPALCQLLVLVSHSLPDVVEETFLNRPVSDWRTEAEAAGYIVEHVGEFVFVRHQNLFNLAAMEEILGSISDLEQMVLSGTRIGSLSALSNPEGLKRLLAGSAIGRDLGPALDRDGAKFEIDRQVFITLTDGRREVRFRVPEVAQDFPDDFFVPQPERSELQNFNVERLPQLGLQPYDDRLVFSFGNASVLSSMRAAAVESFAKRLHELLDEQSKRYETAQAGLIAALERDLNLPERGARVEGLGPEALGFLRVGFSRNFERYGFASESDAQSFLDDAQVSSMQVRPMVNMGTIRPDGQKLLVGALLNFTRNPRR